MVQFWYSLLALMIVLLVWKWKRPRNFPPGPWALPILGNFLQVDFRNPMTDLEKIAKKYGNIFSIYMGSNPVVILHGYKTVKEALVDYAIEFADRPNDPLFFAMSNDKGIAFAPYGEQWKEKRRFMTMLLRNFGMGKTSMESRIQEELKCLMKCFDDKEGCSFQPQEMLRNAAGNAICAVLFGRRFDYSEKKFNRLIQLAVDLTKNISGIWGELYRAFPVIGHLPLPCQSIFTTLSKLKCFLMEIVEEHKKTMKPGEPRDCIDCYLEEMKKRQNTGSSIDDESLIPIFLELFVAGFDTTANTLEWALLFMMTYPHIQENCYKEIKLVIDEKKEVTYEDRHKMPYIQAVTHEIQRFGTVFPLGVPHDVTKETTFLGYTIPKGIRVMANLSSVLFDESQWKFPHEFNPKNFLSDEGEFMKPDAFLPFSAGPRVCMGENLARMQLFLFFTSIIQRYEIVWPEKNKSPDLTPRFGLTQCPISFNVLLKHRRC
ncbi:cytochrome P450 2F2-like [Protopterus annectens]|uniref:cytochrome P450 2F2-like n=1 Tax=Protopterus annectens TaxID=7888 RepID=UPI001CFAE4F3|nr:cytochrome P450 2F2-like [Protopterus annectens]